MKKPWPTVALGQVLHPISRPETVDPTKAYRLLGAHWYAQGLYIKDTSTGSSIAARRVYRVERGDFVYNRLFAWKGSFALAAEEQHGCYVSNEFPCFVADQGRLVPEFLWRYFSRESVWIEALAFSTGGTPTSRNRLKEERFLGMSLPLPPLEEQRRIVAKLDRIAAQSDGVAALQESIQSQTACLMSRIATELLALGRWDEASLGELLVEPSRNGLAARPSSSPPGVPILRISAGTSRPDARVEESDVRYLPLSSAQVEAYSLRPGDVLACRFNGNLEFVGRFSLFEGESRGTRVYPDKLIRFRVDPEKALPRFVVIAMNSKAGRDQIEHFCQTTAGNIGISATNLRTVKMPVPPMTAQRRIVEQLDTLQGKVGTLQELQTEARREVGALMPAILDRAFRGEL